MLSPLLPTLVLQVLDAPPPPTPTHNHPFALYACMSLATPPYLHPVMLYVCMSLCTAAPCTQLSIFEFMAVMQLSGLVTPVTGLTEAAIRIAFLHSRMTVVRGCAQHSTCSVHDTHRMCFGDEGWAFVIYRRNMHEGPPAYIVSC